MFFKDKIFETVALIPKGRVATYGQVAEIAGFPGAARAVGNAIHGNTDPELTPCHRVVHSDGTLGSNYGMGGLSVQKKRLEDEGIAFTGYPPRLDMKRHGIVIESHPLQPFLPENASILFLGSFPPPKARWSMDFFYPNLQNDFWRIQGLIHFGNPSELTDTSGKAFDYQKITEFCRNKGLAFFDTATRVCRLKGNASDEYLKILVPSDIIGMLDRIPFCRTIVTTGGRASEELLEILEGTGCKNACIPSIGTKTETDIGQKRLEWWRMPSTSRAYPMSIQKKAEYYRRLF